MKITSVALEQKRQGSGLTCREFTTTLGVSEVTYGLLRKKDSYQLRPATCGRVAGVLNIPVENVLRWEDYWEKLSPIGKLLLPAIATANLSYPELAKTAGVSTQIVSDALYGLVVPRTETLKRLAAACGLDDPIGLYRAAREMQQLRPHHQCMQGAPQRLRRREGRQGLRRQGDRLQLKLKNVRAQWTPGELQNNREKAYAAMRHRWAIATKQDHLRRSLALLKPHPEGTFGLCRVCDMITYLSPGLIHANAVLKAEYHAACQAEWHRSPEWKAWASAVQRKRWGTLSGRPPEPQPQQPYHPGRRLSSIEIADYYATAVEYLHIVHRTWGGGRRWKREGGRRWKKDESQSELLPETVQEFADNLHLAYDPHGCKVRLEERVDWVRQHLPALANCNANLAKKVRVLSAFLLSSQKTRARPRTGMPA